MPRDDPSQHAIHRAQESELDGISTELAQAFVDNPLNRAAIRGNPARRLRCGLAGMQALLPIAHRVGDIWVTAEARGTLIAAPPGSYPFPAPSPWVELRTLWIQGIGTRMRWAESFEHLRARHPDDPHWVLATIGVSPNARRLGIGSALVTHWLAQVDAEAGSSYLETDRADNLPFYQKFGFEVREESQVLGIPIWHMHRGPRSD